jgi:iron complex outermembrane receptor protein
MQRTRIRKFAYLMAGACWSALLLPAIADAQVAVGTAPSAGTTDSAVAEVVVTAQRRSEKLQDVPIAVTATTAAKLQAAGISDTSDIALITPGFQLRNIAGFSLPNIRGIGANAQGPGIENPVGIYLDGVYLESSAASLFSLANIEQVEVLKGPQGTLFGRNSTGGVVQVITSDPRPTPSGKVSVGYGNYETGVVDFYGTAGLTDTVAANLAIHYKAQGQGWGKNLFNGQDAYRDDDDFVIRPKVLWEPNDASRILLTGNYSYLRSSVLTALSAAPGLQATPFNVLGSTVLGVPLANLGGFYDVNTNQTPNAKVVSYGGSIEARQKLGDSVELKSITAFQNTDYHFGFDIDGTPFPIFALTGIQSRSQQFSEELQLSSVGRSKLQWTVGLYYFSALDSYQPYQVAFGSLGAALFFNGASSANDIIHASSRASSIAGYGQATYEFLPETHLTIGLRYTDETHNLSGHETLDINGFPVFQSVLPYPSAGVPTSIHADNVSYRIALDRKFGEDILGYVSYSTGFKSGGYNLGDPATNSPYLPETMKDVEVGIKSEFFDRRARLNLSAFHYDYSNIQVSTYTGTTQEVTNGAGAELYGGELDAEFRVTRQLTLSGGLSYIHDRFTSFDNADYTYSVPGCVPRVGDHVFICTASAAGKQLVNTPAFTGNISADYVYPLAGGSEINANANVYYSEKYFGSFDNNPNVVQKAYSVVNTNVGWTSPSKTYRVMIWAKNLLDKEYSAATLISEAGIVHKAAAPRTFGATFDYKF